MTPTARPRWFSHRDEAGREDYARRFRRIAARGGDIDGEARFVDAMARRGSRILDAGCGTGRVAAALVAAGHEAVGVDVDPILIDRGQEFYPGLPLATLDLTELAPESLGELGLPTSYDVVVVAGNVLIFVADGTEATIVGNLASVLVPGGRIAIGFTTAHSYTHDDLDRDAAAAGLVCEHRFADWELRPWHDGADWAVSVYTLPAAVE